MVSRHDVLAITVLCFILIIFLSFRFILSPTSRADGLHYASMVQAFKGESPEIQPEPPFTYRILVPFLASRLPFSPTVAINLVSITILLVGTVFTYLTLKHLALHPLMCFAGGLLFVLSPAHLNFAVNGYVDATLIGFLCAGLYFILARRYGIAAIVIIFGFLAKETMIILFPVWFVHAWLRKPKNIYVVAYSATAAILALALVRLWSGTPDYVWFPAASNLDTNLVIGHTLNVLFVFGIVGFLAIPQLAKRQNLALSTGYTMAILLTVYAAMAAWLDGRHIWTIYPFAIPMATMTLQDMAKRLRKFI